MRRKAEEPLTMAFFTWSEPDEKMPLKGSEAQENCLLTTQQPSHCGCQAYEAWGIPLGNRLIVHFHGRCAENGERKNRELDESEERWKIKSLNLKTFCLIEICYKESSRSLFSNMQMLCEQIKTRLTFRHGCFEWTFCLPDLTTMSYGICSHEEF